MYDKFNELRVGPVGGGIEGHAGPLWNDLSLEQLRLEIMKHIAIIIRLSNRIHNEQEQINEWVSALRAVNGSFDEAVVLAEELLSLGVSDELIAIGLRIQLDDLPTVRKNCRDARTIINGEANE